MISLIASLAVLLIGYFIYGKITEKGKDCNPYFILSLFLKE